MAKRVAGRLGKSLRRERLDRPEEVAHPTPEMESRAAAAIQKHANSHATLFERAERLRERAERLESEGTPSDTAQNQAERAESEAATELFSLRASFFKAAGSKEEELAFDRQVRDLYPSIRTF